MTLDQLVVSLVLDTSGLKQGAQDVDTTLSKTKDAAVKHGGAIEGAVGKASESFESLTRKALTTFAVFAGARSIEEFTRKITTVDAAVGRLSASFGQRPQGVDAIGKSVERLGGSAETAMAGLRGLSDQFLQLQMNGPNAISKPIAQLESLTGKTVSFTKDTIASFLSIADALQAENAKDPAKASFLGRQILGSDDLTNLALKGRAGVLAEMAESNKNGVIGPEDVKAGQDLQYAFTAVSQTVQAIGRHIVTAVSPALTKLLTQVDEWLQKIDWDAVDKKVVDFGSKFVPATSAVNDLAKAFAPGSPLTLGIEACGALVLARIVGPLGGMARVMAGLGLLNPAVLGTLAVGGVLASGDPNKSVLAGGHPDVAPQDNDTGLPGGGDRTSDTSRPGGVWSWIKANALPDLGEARESIKAFGKMIGWGDRLKKDDRAADAAVETAEGVKKLVAQGERAAAGSAEGMQGVTASSGGLGGSGRHLSGSGGAGGGGSFPGASLGDHARGGIGRNAAQMQAGARESFDFWLSKGLSREQAAGLVGMEQGESQFNPRIVGDSGAAHGAFQHHPDRRARILAATGINIDTATHAQQLEAAYWEFQHTHRAAWEAIKRGKTATDAARAGVHLFEAPKDKIGQSIVRGGMAEGWLKRFNDQDAGRGASSAGAGTPAPSSAAISDAAVFAARQRIAAGGRDPKDQALVKRYLEQQNAPKKTSFLDGLNRQAPAHVAMLAANAQAAVHSAHYASTFHNDNSSETTINGGIHVHTRATDAQGIVADMGQALRGQRAAKANAGLA